MGVEFRWIVGGSRLNLRMRAMELTGLAGEEGEGMRFQGRPP